MPRTSFTKNIVLISLSISIFVAIVMGFIIGSLVESLKLKDVQLNVEKLVNEELKSADIDYDKIYNNLNSKDPLIIGLNVIDKDGKILYSDEKELAGKAFSDKEEISKTLSTQNYYVIDRNLISQETILKEKYVHVMTIFYKYSINDGQFVVEIIYNILTIEKDINKINVLMWFTVLLSVGIVFVSLITISVSTNKILESSKNSLEINIKKRTIELEKARLRLDQQVKERTTLLEESNKKSIERYYELQKLAKDIQKQNKDLTRKTLELTELKGQLEDKNVQLESANNDIQKQNKDLTRKTLELTDLKWQLEDKNIELESANKQISITLEAKTQFINQAAHDLGTPLTPILTLLPIIKSHVTDEKIIYDLNVVENNANYLSRIVKELITLIKTEARGIEYNFQKLNFKNLVEDIIKNYKIVFDDNKIKVINKIEKNLPMIDADKYKITELLQNILSNAVKFMAKGGELTVAVKKTDNFINVRISDTGTGMSKNTLSMLFEEFFKADKSRHYQGSGLGLSICKKIVQGHNGRIWAESKGIGKGSTISFNLPISQRSEVSK